MRASCVAVRVLLGFVIASSEESNDVGSCDFGHPSQAVEVGRHVSMLQIASSPHGKHVVSQPHEHLRDRIANQSVSQLASRASLRQGQRSEAKSAAEDTDRGQHKAHTDQHRGKSNEKHSKQSPEDAESSQFYQKLMFGGSVLLPFVFLIFGNPIGSALGQMPPELERDLDEKDSFWREGSVGSRK